VTLTCSCDDWDDEAEWYYGEPKPVAPLTTKRSRRCCSCKDHIAVGDDCAEIRRWRPVHDHNSSEIEIRIYGEGGEAPIASWYLCDRCAGLFESLDGLGFCDLIGQDLREVAKEYAQMQRDAGVFRGQMVIQPKEELQ
jgi:hypothetical protein